MKTYIDEIVEKVAERTELKGKNLIRLYSLLVLVKGENITLEDIHDAWSMDMNFKDITPPFCYGREHKSIVPFDQLNEETQNKDKEYLDALLTVAKEMKR